MSDALPAAWVPRDSLHLWWLGRPDQPRRIGEISLARSGRAVALRYAQDWIASGFPLSEDLPLLPDLFVPPGKDMAAGAVDDARPDRWGERVIRKFERSPRLSLLEFLLFAGDDRAGALGVSPDATSYVPWPSAPLPTLANLADMADAVRKVLANEPVPELQRRLVHPGVSLGGARPKSLLVMDDAQWLVKFSEGEDLDTELIEHATLLLARQCGIGVAQTRPLPVAGRHAVAVRRFDRMPGGRVHAVSAKVALHAAGEDLAYPQLAQLLRRLAPSGRIAQQQEELFRRMVFNILVDNTDDHEKNHVLLRQPDGHYLLSPAFDVVPGALGLGYQAMGVGDAGAESSLRNALSRCMDFGLREPAARAVVAQVVKAVDGWKKHFRDVGVRKTDVDVLAQYIDGPNLGAQRAGRGRESA